MTPSFNRSPPTRLRPRPLVSSPNSQSERCRARAGAYFHPPRPQTLHLSNPLARPLLFENIFETVNSGFAQALYEEFLRDPSSVAVEWRRLFESGVVGEEPLHTFKPNGDGSVAGENKTAQTGNVETVGSSQPIKGPQLRLLKNMEASLDVPTATSFRDIDASYLWKIRSDINQQLKERGLKLSFTHIIGWAIVKACDEFPSMVYAVTDIEGEPHRLDPGSTNLGLAVDVERRDGTRGLMVPVIKNANTLTFAEFHADYDRLVEGARTGKLLPDAYAGSTITLTNPGTIGTVASVPRLMKGQGSIIATGAIQSIGERRSMTVTSTYDHRIIQGAESGQFLQTVDKLLQGERDFYGEIATAFNIDVNSLIPVTAERPADMPSPQPSIPQTPEPSSMLFHVAAAMSLVKAHRTHGHRAAQLDPLGSKPPGDPALDPTKLGLTPDIMKAIPSKVLRIYLQGETLHEAFPNLRKTYCGTIAYEIEHIDNHEERVWLRKVIESGEHCTPLSTADRKLLLDDLTRVDGLERFLHRSYLGHKRFGIEGLDSLVPMIRYASDIAASQGAGEVVLGMAHRGRLNILTHIVGVSYETLLAEFEGGKHVEETLAPAGGTGDVKYHHGSRGKLTTSSGADIDITLLPNPSHLEAVDPVVQGRVRAIQTQRDGSTLTHDTSKVLAILIHGDAAFAAQGVVAETFNLSRLSGYSTGGTLHVIANNQIGFTTNPVDARSTDNASSLALGFDVPIIHVNADDPEMCIAAVRLAMMYRVRFKVGCVIDLVGYRRHGHNEGDEPRFTQPQMYQVIDSHPTVRELYAAKLVSDGIIEQDEVDRKVKKQYELLAATQEALKKEAKAADEGEEPDRVSASIRAVSEPETGVAEEILRTVNEALLTPPESFTVNPKLDRQLKKRADAFDGQRTIDWGHAESLAFGTLLQEGVPIRLTGQDVGRGTFSHRHTILCDFATGEEYVPLQHLPDSRATFEIHNSPLSEYAVLGFEYGYSVATPEVLVVWEAQFGDFANAAEVIIDQFIIAGLAKWGQTTRLTLLLPHGYEGQGPEHSSARIERYLALAAEGNIRVANCSTPAQYFHLLRRQAKSQEIRPLILMTPKSLLRLPRAASSMSELSQGCFHEVIDDESETGAPQDVTKLVFCSGKIYYDLINSGEREKAAHVGIARIELLYPFPENRVAKVIEGYANLSELIWLQEEPENMGARKWVVPKLERLAPTGTRVQYLSRPERSSPAEGYPAAHTAEQLRLVTEALA